MDTPSVPTLDALAAALGAPDLTLLESVITQDSREALTARGAEVASSRIIVDTARIYGLAYMVWEKATAEQQESLVGFSPELLSIAVDRAVALRDLTSDADDAGHADEGMLEAAAAAAIAAFARGLPRRDHLHTVLRGVAGTDPELKSRVELAVGTADDAEALTKGMKRLVAIGREVLTTMSGPILSRAKLARMTTSYLDMTDALADEVRATGRAASTRATARKVAQGEIDFLDGVNLQLLSTIIAAFEAAHDVDPSIPRLVPIATRRALGKGRRAKKESATEAGKGAPEAGEGTSGMAGGAPVNGAPA